MKVDLYSSDMDSIASVKNNSVNTSRTDSAKIDVKETNIVKEKKEPKSQKIDSTNSEDYVYSKDVSEEEIKETIDKMNEKFTSIGRKLEYSVHDETNEIMIKVINTEDESVIREIPSEKLLDMAARMYEFAGLLVDEKR